ncbi:MAG: hypothetical protein JSC161_000436 [Candidatus Tokpelaia sp. JSC161]|jgi:2-oxo-4-hydroxy-4-carboxy-5-ureidoimidazoline decarboxylase|nr:MAG: hypothetical protein JSC161_000436 [Candidatus Tokpelaia sp. JSC161]
MPCRTNLKDLNKVSPKIFCSTLSGIFEHSPWIAKRVISKRPFNSVESLYKNMLNQVMQSDTKTKMNLIHAHPELTNQTQTQKRLTQESRDEQETANLMSLTDKEASEFHQLNKDYKRRFGFPFIIAVKGFEKPHNKLSILITLRKRIQKSYPDEYHEALRQIARIAEIRLKELVKE